MLKSRLENLDSERGTTLIELLVATVSGVIVMFGLATLIIVVLHGTARVNARVDATQRGRIAMTRIIEQLHNACTAPKITPILVGSTGTTLKFTHAVGAQTTAVAPNPTTTELIYSGGTLTEKDTLSGTTTTTTLLTSVAPIAPRSSIFRYFRTVNDASTEIVPGSTGLSEAQTVEVIEVRVGFSASPGTTPIADAGSATSIEDGAILRLTPPSYNEKATAPPCQ